MFAGVCLAMFRGRTKYDLGRSQNMFRRLWVCKKNQGKRYIVEQSTNPGNRVYSSAVTPSLLRDIVPFDTLWRGCVHACVSGVQGTKTQLH